jgi:hypothetical protein
MQFLAFVYYLQKEAIEQFKEKYPVSNIHKELKKPVKDFNKLINSCKWRKEKEIETN